MHTCLEISEEVTMRSNILDTYRHEEGDLESQEGNPFAELYDSEEKRLYRSQGTAHSGVDRVGTDQ